ncbi:hypothetical protein AAD018_010635 [Aestuariibius insulae]|uniref:hypothetical protein n=1 Tax=Aestuariibius insulae TaxID=2058287 RepID=UPI00398E8742
MTLTFAISPFFSDPFSGFAADQFPIPQVDPPIQPVGWAFSIWGLIYGWLIVSAGYGLWKRADASDWDRARLPLILSLAAGTPWLAVALANAEAATVLIWIMLGTALWALLAAPLRDRWWFAAPVGLYAGWLTAASFVSLASFGAGYGLLTDQTGWAYIGIAGALIVGALVLLRRPGTVTYPAAIAWALIGIIAANGLENTGISATAAIGIVILAALTFRGNLTSKAASPDAS